MLKNYLKTAWRNILHDKTHALLNVISLSAGLTCFTLIALWVWDELSYDKFNVNYDRIVRLTATEKTLSGIKTTAYTSAPMAKALQQDYSEVETAVRLRLREEIITQDGQQILQPGILLTDPSFFDVFSYTLSRGNRADALKEPYSVVLTQSAAEKYFGNSDPMGRTLLMNMYDSTGTGALYKVTGVMPDPPKNAHFTFQMLASFSSIEAVHPELLTADGWGDASFYTYLLLRKNVDLKSFSAKIEKFYGKYIGDRFKAWEPIYSYHLQPLADIYLRSEVRDGIGASGSMTRVYVFSVIGIFILLLAAINYTNLATARAAGRAKEVSIKKVVGASKRQVMEQYLTESVCLSMAALLFAMFSTVMLQPLLFQLTGKDVSLWAVPVLVLFLVVVTLLLGILAGLYPAFILSAFKPVIALRGSFKSGSRGIALRRTLVVSQFVITVVLVTGIVIIYSQMSYIRKKDLGYDKDALLFIKVNGNTDVIRGYSAFRDDVQKSPLVQGMTTSNSLIVGGLSSGGSETIDASGNPLQVNTTRLRVDSMYFATYGISLVAGKNFTRQDSATQQVIVNEMAVRKFGWGNAASAIGKPFKTGNSSAKVIGVVKDFYYNTLQQPLEALAIYPAQDRFSRITIKADMTRPDEVVKLVKSSWKKHFPGALFDYNFVNEQIKIQYEAEERFFHIFFCFSVLSLLIACLGLYGLISYTVFQRTKEIGIRKVLGASASNITAMLSADLLGMLLVACCIATPVAWMTMNNWLDNFAYRITPAWWMFAVAGLLVLLIALGTIGAKAWRAAIANPVKSLRAD